MASKTLQSLSIKDFSIYLTTWNVGGVLPPNDIANLFGLDVLHIPERLPDLFGVGLQEVDSNPKSMVTETFFTNPWSTAISGILCKNDYVKLSSIRLLGILLLVFVKRQHVPHINTIQTNYTRTGLAGVWGNKGGVSISLNIYNRTVCITNCHLAAHQENYKDRISDCESIIDSEVFRDLSETIIEHDYIFWLGDLNFRIDELDVKTVKRLIDCHDFHSLLQHDQLIQAMKNEEIFMNFKEGLITFPPTYKFDRDSDLYDTSGKHRKPAWCDRILWRVNFHNLDRAYLDIKEISYHYHPKFKVSDHKAVSASFRIRVSHNINKLIQFKPVQNWKVDHDGNCNYKIHAEADVTNWDWIGLFKSDFHSLEDYETYVWATRENPSIEDCSVKIPGQYIKNAGQHRLLYISKRYECAFGMSQPFQISA